MVFYPINLNVAGRRCLVVGGGAVAVRKIESLLLSGALIRVVSPIVCGKIADLAGAGTIEWLRREYRDGDLEGVFLVFAATSQPAVQQQIAEQAKKSGVLLNSADSPNQCDFQVPAKIRRGDLLIAVSTGGASPALSAQIKHRLYLEFGPEYGDLVDLLAAIRRQVVDRCGSSKTNRELFGKLLEQPLAEMIRAGQWEEIRTRLETILPETIDCESLIEGLPARVAKCQSQSTGGRGPAHDQ